MKNCLPGRVKLLRNPIKNKFIYNGREIVFDGEASWSFCKDFARNVVTFVKWCNFQYWKKDQMMGIMIAMVQQKKKLELVLVKQRQNFP